VPWYLWVLLWAVLLILGLVVLARLGLSLWRKAVALAKELSTAADRFAAVSDGLQDLAEKTSEPAVFTPASQLRQERILSARRPDGGRSAGQVPESGRPSTRPAKQRVR
jgi:hypothetical protein